MMPEIPMVSMVMPMDPHPTINLVFMVELFQDQELFHMVSMAFHQDLESITACIAQEMVFIQVPGRPSLTENSKKI